MMSMQDYINNVKSNVVNSPANFEDKTKSHNSFVIPNMVCGNDSFEKKDIKIDTNSGKNLNKKIDKKKIFKIGAIVATIALAIVAFVKRKQIGSALSGLFNKKKSPEPPTPPTSTTPPPTGSISNSKTPPAAPSLASDAHPKDASDSLSGVINNPKAADIIKVPEPTFGANPTIEEKQQYCATLLNHINNEKVQKEEITDALDKLSQYGENSDIEKINYYVWNNRNEDVILALNKVVDKLGKKGDDFCVYEYLTRDCYQLSYSGSTEILKTLTKLREDVFTEHEYDKLIRCLLEKIPDDKTGEFTEALVELLTTAGKKEYISFLDKYLINFSYVNKFMNQGQKTPQCIVDVIDKLKKMLDNKK